MSSNQLTYPTFCRQTWTNMARSLRRICTGRRSTRRGKPATYTFTPGDLSWMRDKIAHYWAQERGLCAPKCEGDSPRDIVAWIDLLCA